MLRPAAYVRFTPSEGTQFVPSREARVYDGGVRPGLSIFNPGSTGPTMSPFRMLSSGALKSRFSGLGSRMDKEKKSARELADMITLRMKVAAGLVSIHRDATCGWAANVFTGPSKLFGDQALAEAIAAELRERYDLKD